MPKRHTETIARVDIRIPHDIYEQIMAIATNHFHAKIHHRSGKPEVSPTILELIKIGIAHLDPGGTDKPDISDKSVVTELRQQIKELDKRLSEVESKLSDESVTDNITDIPDIINPSQDALEGMESHQDDESYQGITKAGIAVIFDKPDKTDIEPDNSKSSLTDSETDKPDSQKKQLTDNKTDKPDKQGLTDTELAEVLKVSSTVIRRYRISGKKPRLRKILAQLEEWEVSGDRWVKKH